MNPVFNYKTIANPSLCMLFVKAIFVILSLMTTTHLSVSQAIGSENPVNFEIYNKGEPFNILVVQKSTQQLTVYSAGDKQLKVVRQFACSTGKVKGLKAVEGDAKTPSGIYFITGEILDKDLAAIYGTRAFPLDYPNALDRKKNLNGSAIWLHGTDKKLQPYQTNGCVAMDNENIDALKSYIRLNRTPVIITETLGNITVTHNEPWQIELDKNLSIRSNSLKSGSYHDYLSIYHPDYLPDITWWGSWKELRSKPGIDASLSLERLNLFAVSTGEKTVALFDQYLVGNEKKINVGSLKFFLSPFYGNLRVIAEEYQETPSHETEAKNQSPLILAGRRFQEPSYFNQEIESMIDAWLESWSKKEIKQYASFYSKEFKSQNNFNLKQWIAYKEMLNKRYKSIKVSRKGLGIKQDKDELRVSFIQYYKNDSFSSKTNKTIILIKEGGIWKILREF